MPKQTFEVPVRYRGMVTFMVEAETAKEAEQKAEQLFKDGEDPSVFGNEWEEIETVHEARPVIKPQS